MFTMATEDLIGLNEVARMAGVSRQAVSNWRSRFSDFPKPVVELSAGPVFDRFQVRSWLRKRRVQMAQVISTINLKGGVGKTHTTVALAEITSAYFNKRVLVIDLDPQTNATVMLIGEDRWQALNQARHTLARLFEDAFDPENRVFNLEATRQRNVSDVQGARIDLLPSSLDLIEIQDRLATIPPGRFYAQNPIDILARAVRPILDEYDFIFIDCPPNLGIITLNGLKISNAYIIPTIPDILSTYGIPQIVTRVSQFSEQIAQTIEPLGIVVSKYRAQSPLHNRTLNLLRSNGTHRLGTDVPAFGSVICEDTKIAEAAEFIPGKRRTIKQKYGYRGEVDAYWRLARELLQKVGDQSLAQAASSTN
jgi:chromosome partitioning protein